LSTAGACYVSFPIPVCLALTWLLSAGLCGLCTGHTHIDHATALLFAGLRDLMSALPRLGVLQRCSCRSLSGSLSLVPSVCALLTWILFAGLRDLLSALPGLDDLQLGSCRSLSRGARQAAAAGVEQLKRHLQETAAAEQPGRRRR
jgi:hypothetical protein